MKTENNYYCKVIVGVQEDSCSFRSIITFKYFGISSLGYGPEVTASKDSNVPDTGFTAPIPYLALPCPARDDDHIMVPK